MRAAFSKPGLTVVLSISFLICVGCSTASSAVDSPVAAKAVGPTTNSKGSTIEIKPNSPADTVRAFYNALREKKFREAIFLTNLRPAIEGLTDTELKEFQVDFEAIAKHVPKQLEINGEIISGNSATVTAKLPTEDLDRTEIQEIRLRKDGDVWVILSVDETAEKRIKQEGKNYFPALRIETHQDEARDMLDRVAKAQMAYATQNRGGYGDMDALIKAELLPDDIRSAASTGYRYSVTVTQDRRRYSAAAVPEVYGKTGKLSFAVELDSGGQPRLVSSDAGTAKTK